MKLPNGFGSVHKLPGNRRKPWRARKTSGWVTDSKTGEVKQKYVTIGYFSTQKEALQALVQILLERYAYSEIVGTFILI